jgi:hypothetical protein
VSFQIAGSRAFGIPCRPCWLRWLRATTPKLILSGGIEKHRPPLGLAAVIYGDILYSCVLFVSDAVFLRLLTTEE